MTLDQKNRLCCFISLAMLIVLAVLFVCTAHGAIFDPANEPRSPTGEPVFHAGQPVECERLGFAGTVTQTEWAPGELPSDCCWAYTVEADAMEWVVPECLLRSAE